MTCRTCGEDKPQDGFYWRRDLGRPFTECKACHHARTTKWRRDNVERARRISRRAQRKAHLVNPGHSHAADRRWIEANREKKRAHQAVDRALRRGDLVKPDACEECGGVNRLHGHHDDYSRQLEVRWLCVPCHWAVHMEDAA